MTLVLAIFAVGAMLGAALAAPIFYALGSEHTHRGTIEEMRQLRARRHA